jgi:sodium transport system ATP-binding protein
VSNREILVEADHLEKRFPGYAAVRGISLRCYAGEVFGLLGPNGAGKTTTLRMLTTVLRPTAGTARIAGHDVVTDSAAVRRAIGVLPENAGVYGRLTARESIRYTGQLYGVPADALDARLEALAATLDLTPHLDRLCETFSKGMKQKVNVARALVHNPPVIFLDEPTSGLDVISARAVRDFVEGAKRDGRCVILSTHVMDEADKLCDRVAIVAAGRVRAEGTLADLKAQSGLDLEDLFVQQVAEARA